MVVLVALHEVEDQVPDVEGSAPHSSVVVLSQRLLVLGRAEEGDVMRFVQLVHGVLMGCLGSLFVVCPDPWCSIVEVRREDGLSTVDHEERCVAGGPAGSCSQAPEHSGELGDPSCAEFVQPVEDPGFEAL